MSLLIRFFASTKCTLKTPEGILTEKGEGGGVAPPGGAAALAPKESLGQEEILSEEDGDGRKETDTAFGKISLFCICSDTTLLRRNPIPGRSRTDPTDPPRSKSNSGGRSRLTDAPPKNGMSCNRGRRETLAKRKNKKIIQ